MGDIWSIAFRTYFSNPPKPTPLAELNIHDLKTTYLYYNDLIKINGKQIEPTKVHELQTIEDVWDEDEQQMISKEKMVSIFYHIPKRNINAFHKQISQLYDQISTLLAGASRQYPIPIIIQMGKSHYLLDEREIFYSGHIDPHSSAFTANHKSQTDITDLLKHKIYHPYQIMSKTSGIQYIKTNRITKPNLNSNKWYDINKRQLGCAPPFLLFDPMDTFY
jgi:hypothetical protein